MRGEAEGESKRYRLQSTGEGGDEVEEEDKAWALCLVNSKFRMWLLPVARVAGT